jgi:hypothetical protein
MVPEARVQDITHINISCSKGLTGREKVINISFFL